MGKNFSRRLATMALVAALTASAGANAAVPGPSEEAIRLGRELAQTSDFQALFATVTEVQIGELQRDTPGLDATDKASVAQIGHARAGVARTKILDQLGAIYAQTFSVSDLKQMVAFFASPAGRAYTGRYAETLPALAKALSGFDFKAETLKDICAQIHKGCPTQ